MATTIALSRNHQRVSLKILADITFDVSGNAVIRASDVPYDDPVGALLHKSRPVDRRHRSRVERSEERRFTVKYYAGYYSSRSSCTRDKPYAHVGYAYGF